MVLAVGEIVTVRSIWPIWKLKQIPQRLLDGPDTSKHMSAFLPFKFPASGKYDAVLDSCVTTATTMHVRAAKALFYVIMHKVY